MKKEDILEELDKLRIKIMLDIGNELPSDLKRFEEWIDELQLRGKFSLKPFSCRANEKYANYSFIRSCVDDLYYKRNDSYEYQKNRNDIRRIIGEVVAMTMFYQEELNKTKK